MTLPIAYGIVLPTAMMTTLRNVSVQEHWRDGRASPLLMGLMPYSCLRIVEDPALPDMAYEVAYSEQAWRKRLAKIERACSWCGLRHAGACSVMISGGQGD